MPRLTAFILMLAAAAPAAAQDNAVKSAVDAFGERVGTEQSGLYSESQVRGFDLNDSGAYRIDEAYFSRAAALNDPVLAGVGVRVGVNAARLAGASVALRFEAPQPNVPSSDFYDQYYLDWFEIDYRRVFAAGADGLRFSYPISAPTDFLVTGLANQDVAVFDVTDPGRALRMTGSSKNRNRRLRAASPMSG